MKDYIRFSGLGVLFGIMCYFSGNTSVTDITLSEIILLPTFVESDYFPFYIIKITHWFIPLLVFQILYGTYIYRHFCSASVYFFSRNKNRTMWFLRESLKLYGFTICFLTIMLITGIIITGIDRRIIFDKVAIYIYVYYMLTHSFFLFVTTLGINILSIKFSSIMAFAIVEGISLLGIGIYTMTGNFFTDETLLIEQYAWVLKVNPFAHLVFSMHSSCVESVNRIINVKGINFDLNISVMLYAGIALVTVALGCLVVKRFEFLSNNREVA